MPRCNRRDFLGGAVATALAAGLAATSLEARAELPGYRALVCLFLFGGNDSFNMVVPRSEAEYNVYAQSRQNLAIERSALLPINPLDPDGAQYGLHPAMSGVQQLFESGRLAVVANLGPLIRPTSRGEYLDKAVSLPPQLFSHNDQQDQWQTLKGRKLLRSGWAGRIADQVAAEVAGQQLPMNVSLSGASRLQLGEQAAPYAVSTNGAVTYAALESSISGGSARRTAFEALLGAPQQGLYARALNGVHGRALAMAQRVNEALSQAPVFGTAFPQGGLGQQLQMVARLIAVRELLSVSRQVFFVSMGGFDTHDDQVDLQPGLLGGVSAGLAAFASALDEIGAAPMVTTFTMSDFGRTLTSNGDGTDHGWGGHQLVMGGSVIGRRVYGTMPRLEIGGPDDTSGGRIIPTISADQYAATLARWLGLSEPQLDVVAPQLANFGVRDLGFLGT